MYDTYNQNWTHDAGRVCFQRDIDPELYNEVREKQYKMLLDGRLYESKEYIEKFMKILF